MKNIFALLAVSCALSSLACGDGTGDVSPDGAAPSPLGTKHIRDYTDPASPLRAANGSVVTVTGTSILAVDNFDETGDGKSRGTVYIQDFGSKFPYSGISLYAPNFIPSDLRPATGDVLDFHGPYSELASIGTAVFPAGQLVTQLANPIGTFRFEGSAPEPVDIEVDDLASYEKGKKWVGMLVRVKNLKLLNAPYTDKARRVTIQITPGVPKDASSMSNELMDLGGQGLAKDQTLQSVTGVVTYFFTLKLAPRNAADIVR